MKKLLSILTSLAVVSTTATSVVACSTPSTKVDVNIKGNNITTVDDGKTYTFNGAKYTKSELFKAMNGNASMFNSMSHVAMSFDELNIQLVSLLTFNQSLTVKTQKNQRQLRNFRNNYLGRAANEVTEKNYKNLPSIDGIHYDAIDNTDEYYKKFKNTNINTMVGLQDLYNYDKTGKKIPEPLKAAWTMAEKLFNGKDKDVNELMNNFANSRKNPAFTNITYDTDLQQYKSTSQVVTPFDKNNKNESITLGDTVAFADNNGDIKATNGKDKDNKTLNITQMANEDPYGVLLLPTTDSSDAEQINASLDLKPNDDKEKILGEAFKKMGDSNEVAAAQLAKKDDSKDKNKITSYELQQNFGQYFVKKAKPLKVTYHFETDMKPNAKDWKEIKEGSKGFDIQVSLDNLAEVFSPYMSGIQGLTITSIKHVGEKTRVYFNKSDLKDIDDIKKNLTGATITSTKVEHDTTKDKKGKNETPINSWVEVDAKSGTLELTSGKAKLNYTFAADKDSEYDNTQLSWIFRGYKFISEDAMDNKLGNFGWTDKVTNEDFVDLDGNAPKRNEALEAEVTHNLRDIKTTDIKVKSNNNETNWSDVKWDEEK